MTPPMLKTEPVTTGRLRLTSVLGLYVARLRGRWIQELLAVVGIAAGVALLYATQVASTSLSGPIQALNHGIVGNSQLQLMSRGFAGFPEQTYDDVAALPGVIRAAPVLQVAGNVAGPRGERPVTYFGADPRIVKLRGSLLQGFNSSDAAEQQTVVLPSATARAIGVGVGDDARIQIAGRTLVLPIVVADRDQIGDLVDTSMVLVPLAYLQRLARTGPRVTRILVQAQPGQQERVRRGLEALAARETADVRPGDYETRLFAEAARPTTQASTIFSVLSALIGWLFAVCALLVTAAERRKLAVQQRDQGYAPSATLLTLLVDVAIVGLVGSAAGLAIGELISRQGFSSDVSFLSGAFPVGDVRVVSVQSIVIACAGGLLAAAVGVLAPVGNVVADSLPRRQSRRRPGVQRPQGALDDRARSPTVRALGIACLVAAVGITIAAPRSAVIGLILLAVALVLLLPTILDAAVAGLAWFNRGEPVAISAVFAVQQLTERRWRTRALAITTTGAVAVFGATALQGARANLQAGLDDVVRGLDNIADVWVVPRGAGGVMGTIPFTRDASTQQRLGESPAVQQVALYRSGLLDIADRRAWVIGPPADARTPLPPHQVLDGDVATATARLREGGWATVSRAIADRLHLHVGQQFILPSPRSTTMRVAAITTNLGWSGGALVMNADDVARVWGSASIAGYHVRARPGAAPQQVRQQVTAAVGRTAALRVETAAERVGLQNAASRSGLSRLRQIALLTLVAAVLAMSAAMVGLLWQHRRLVAERKYQGLPTGLLWRSLIAETGVLFGTGALAGGVFGVLGQVLCTRGVQVVTGFPVVHHLRLDIAASSVALVIGASLLVILVPGYLVARAEPTWHD